MSVNKYLPHVYVLPEDDANRELANGFQLAGFLDERRMQVLEEAGGWQEVMYRFKTEHIPKMEQYGNRFMVLLIDFDQRSDRLTKVLEVIPEQLIDRVFILGVWTEPEELKTKRRDACRGASYEDIGLDLAKDCSDDTNVTWSDDLLTHNADELERLRTHVRPFLFPAVKP